MKKTWTRLLGLWTEPRILAGLILLSAGWLWVMNALAPKTFGTSFEADYLVKTLPLFLFAAALRRASPSPGILTLGGAISLVVLTVSLTWTYSSYIMPDFRQTGFNWRGNLTLVLAAAYASAVLVLLRTRSQSMSSAASQTMELQPLPVEDLPALHRPIIAAIERRAVASERAADLALGGIVLIAGLAIVGLWSIAEIDVGASVDEIEAFRSDILQLHETLTAAAAGVGQDGLTKKSAETYLAPITEYVQSRFADVAVANVAPAFRWGDFIDHITRKYIGNLAAAAGRISIGLVAVFVIQVLLLRVYRYNRELSSALFQRAEGLAWVSASTKDATPGSGPDEGLHFLRSTEPLFGGRERELAEEMDRILRRVQRLGRSKE